MQTTTTTTFCRVCEPSCGLQAELQDGRVTRLRPDAHHPVTRGFACHKGLYFVDIHHDPDRLNYPLRRRGDKQFDADAESVTDFERIEWDTALQEIAARLSAIQARHGHQAIAGYVGNPLAFNTFGNQAAEGFFKLLQTPHIFSAGTQDCANKFAGSEAVFGTSTLHPLPDLERTHFALIFGENPKVSHMSFVSIANPMEKLRAARKRGATITYVNPRHIESATPATGDVIQIKPDTDLYLMAALLNELDRAGLFRDDVIAAHGKHIEGLRAFIQPYSAESVAAVTGIAAQDIRALALAFGQAPSACVHMSTGVNMGRQGTLCYWLLHMLSFVTGNLDRPGGNHYSLGFYPAARAGRIALDQVFFNSEFGELRHIRGALPGNLLADMIESPTQPIRALVVLAGNPLLSMAGEERLRAAFAKLDLLVVLDLYRNATGELADYLLPCTDMLERSDVNICGLGMQHEPFVQFTEAVTAPQCERKHEWWILNRLQQEMGLPHVFDQGGENALYQRLDHMMRHVSLTVSALRDAPQQVAVLPNVGPGRLYSDWLQTPDRKVDCCPPLFAEAIQRAHALFDELSAEDSQQLKLINLRTHYIHNSWFQNLPVLKRAGQQTNTLHMAPEDAERRQLQNGVYVQIASAWGEIEAPVYIDDTLRSGVVAMSHGWGNQRSRGLSVASRFPGNNVNRLLPSGPGSYEKLSNQAFMSGVPVQVRRV